MKKSQFTLVEILVTIVIIIILVGMLMPVIKKAAEKADRASTIDRMQVLQQALEEYKEFHGFYPQKPLASNPNAFKITTTFLNDPKNWKAIPKYAGSTPSDGMWKGKFGSAGLDMDLLTDPYGEYMYYLCPGVMNPEGYDLWSMGPDMMHGESGSDTDITHAQTRDDNDDVTNWKNDFN